MLATGLAAAVPRTVVHPAQRAIVAGCGMLRCARMASTLAVREATSAWTFSTTSSVCSARLMFPVSPRAFMRVLSYGARRGDTGEIKGRRRVVCGIPRVRSSLHTSSTISFTSAVSHPHFGEMPCWSVPAVSWESTAMQQPHAVFASTEPS